VTLDQLLARSRDLNAELQSNFPPSVNNDISMSTGQSNTNTVPPLLHSLPRIDRNLTQVLDAGNRLWKSLGCPTEFSESDKVKAAMLFKQTDTNFTLPSKNAKLQKLIKNVDLAPLEPCRDLDQLLNNERENVILALLDNADAETDAMTLKSVTDGLLNKWEKEKKAMAAKLANFVNSDNNATKIDSQSFFNTTIMNASKNNISSTKFSSMSSLERTFGNIIRENITGDLLQNIIHQLDRLATVSRRTGLNNSSSDSQDDIIGIWHLLNQLIQKNINHEKSKQKAIHGAGIDYLENRFRRFVEKSVKSQKYSENLPTTSELVNAYTDLNLRHGKLGPDDVVYAKIYFSLRMGDVDTAIEFSSDEPTLCQALAQWRGSSLINKNHYVAKASQRVDSDLARSLVLIYKQLGRDSAYHKALLSCLGCGNAYDENSKVIDNSECWMWLKMNQIENIDSPSSSSSSRQSYSDFQTNLVTSPEGTAVIENFQDNPLIYVKLLLLSQQFSLALDVLTKYGCAVSKTHAPHIAMALNNARLLDDNKIYNYSKHLISYVSTWQSSSPETAVHYYYNLKYITDVSETSRSLFHETVCNLLSDNFSDPIFDILFSKGSGEVYKFLSSSQANQLFEQIASDAEENGKLQQACKFYEAAGMYEMTVDLLVECLANGKTNMIDFAQSFIERIGVQTLEQVVDNIEVLFLVMDISQLLEKLNQAEKMPIDQTRLSDISSYEILNAIKIIPMENSQVESCCEKFRIKSSKLRQVFPQLLVATMKMYVRLSNTAPEEKYRLSAAASALVMFSGRIKYRTSAQINAQLVHLQLSV